MGHEVVATQFSDVIDKQRKRFAPLEDRSHKIAEWFKVRDGRIVKHAIYYDPREFIKAFGMQ